MSHQEKYFITSSNFKKLVFASKIWIHSEISEVYREIFDKANVSNLINHNEARRIRKVILFLQESEERLISLEAQNKFTSGRKPLNSSTGNFLFESGPPKYHTSSSCETLSKDFDNFEVPEEVISRGEDEVKAFRDFARANRKLLGEGKEDIFLLRLQNQFSLHSRIGKVSFPNSGKIDVPSQTIQISPNEIADKIEVAIEVLNSFRATPEGLVAFKKLMYAPINRLHDSELSFTEVERSLLEGKRNLINLIMQYHIQKHRGGNTTFSAKLLEMYGFKACGSCCEDNIDVGF